MLVGKRNKVECLGDKENFDKKFGAIFNEFNGEKCECCYFYPLFFFRRSLIVSLVFLVTEPVIRLVLSLILSLTVNCI